MRVRLDGATAVRTIERPIVNLVVIALWLASGVDYFWPVWVLLGTSVALVVEYMRYRHASQ